MQRYAYLLIIPAVFILDRWTKAFIVQHLPYLSGMDVTSFLSIVNVRNYGGAFGFLSQHWLAHIIFLFVPMVIIVILVYCILARPLSLSRKFALTCILSGALGNIYDRFFYGYVIDFIDVYYGNHHWPAFNVADIFITSGICLWLLTHAFSSTHHASSGKERY